MSIVRPIKSERSLRRYTQPGSAWRIEFKGISGEFIEACSKAQVYRCLRGTFGGGESREVRAVKHVEAEPVGVVSDVPFDDRRYTLKYADGAWSGAFINEPEYEVVGYGFITLEQLRALNVNQYATDQDGDRWYRTT